ncbi:MAG: HEPN domain protein [Candidatus Scalindua rubra]|uniref:HEPN domain protein n=1 Tax=Candidatus Scalindua rubra TaxID=1872076 RepID=A0A1E3X448_9BACT|nr:MAG: HEPN domain protein [Candidatus Scalindua rubra]
MGKLSMNQPAKRRTPTTPEDWITHALSDFKLAQLGKENEDVLHEQTCFHTQQAVEKALKAVLLFCKIDFPLTHDLEELIDILEKAGISLPPEIMDIGILTPYAVETSYPGHWEEITMHDVEEAISLAENVLKWTEEYIKKR